MTLQGTSLPAIAEALSKTDWELLAEQKRRLVELLNVVEADGDSKLDGLLNWLDAIQGAADSDGYEVVYLVSEET